MDKCGYIGSNFKINMDRFSYKDLVRECFRKINTEGYNLYQNAKTISSGREWIKIVELTDKELIDNMIFKKDGIRETVILL